MALSSFELRPARQTAPGLSSPIKMSAEGSIRNMARWMIVIHDVKAFWALPLTQRIGTE
jgi:hypothetical protein